MKLQMDTTVKWPPLAEVVDTWELPPVLIKRYNAAGGEGTTLCGIFIEIRRTWASVDNCLFLWRFDNSQLGGPKLDQWPGLAQLPGWHAYQNWDKGKAPLYEGNLPRDMAGVLLEDVGADLLMKMLTLDPKKRITAKEAKNHPYFGVKNRHQGTFQIPENPQI